MGMQRIALVLLLAPLAATAAPQRLPIPRIEIPGLDRLLREDPALTTSMPDTYGHLPFFDGFEPAAWQPVAEAMRTAEGKFKLPPGTYAIDLDSFCARSGAPAPYQGAGIHFGPYLGKQAKLLSDLMRRYTRTPEVSRSDAQLLVWAILSRAKPQDMQGGARRAAEVLLTKEEMLALNGFGLEVLNDNMMRQVLPRVNQALRPLFEIDNRMRRFVAEANRPFDEIERLAVLPPNPNAKIEVPAGRWIWDPQGFLFRYRPHSYSSVRMEFVVPHPPKVARDDRGRIVRLECPPGWVSEVVYDDTVAPFTSPEYPNLRAYAFKKVRLQAPNRADPSAPRTFEIDDAGWTFVGKPDRGRRAGTEELWLRRLVPALPQQGRFGGWVDRARGAHDRYQQYEEAVRQAERAQRIAGGNASSDDFFDRGHYRDGLDAAGRGSAADRIDWIAEHHARQNEALIHATNIIGSLPDGSATYDPSGGIGVPGGGGQRLMVSGRGR
jgi:hypothetical protein